MDEHCQILCERMHEVDASIEYVDFLGRNRLEVNFEGEFGVYA